MSLYDHAKFGDNRPNGFGVNKEHTDRHRHTDRHTDVRDLLLRYIVSKLKPIFYTHFSYGVHEL